MAVSATDVWHIGHITVEEGHRDDADATTAEQLVSTPTDTAIAGTGKDFAA